MLSVSLNKTFPSFVECDRIPPCCSTASSTLFQENEVSLSNRMLQMILDIFEDHVGVDYEQMYKCLTAAHAKTSRLSQYKTTTVWRRRTRKQVGWVNTKTTTVICCILIENVWRLRNQFCRRTWIKWAKRYSVEECKREALSAWDQSQSLIYFFTTLTYETMTINVTDAMVAMKRERERE